jgi:hypothetical protein
VVGKIRDNLDKLIGLSLPRKNGSQYLSRGNRNPEAGSYNECAELPVKCSYGQQHKDQVEKQYCHVGGQHKDGYYNQSHVYKE